MTLTLTSDVPSEVELNRAIEGCPNGSREDLLRLSFLPEVAAFPNPHIPRLLEDSGTPNLNHKADVLTPFDRDISEGKADPIYFAHAYSTKVPPGGILPLILHYTRPGDWVLDGFCGTGMTGVAAQLCGEATHVVPLRGEVGRRKAILTDLSPAATFIAGVTNRLALLAPYLDEIDQELAAIAEEHSRLYRTRHVGWSRGTSDPTQRVNRPKAWQEDTEGVVEYIVWSDVFRCPSCLGELVYWDLIFAGPGEATRKDLVCSHCSSDIKQRDLQRVWIDNYDFELGTQIKQAKQTPVMINYSVGTKRFEKIPDADDFRIISELLSQPLGVNIPVVKMQDGFNTRQPKTSHGFTHVHHFFTRRNLKMMGQFWTQLQQYDDGKRQLALYILTGSIQRVCRLNRYMPSHDRHVGPLSGTLYVSQLTAELPALAYMRARVADIKRCTGAVTGKDILVSTQSATTLANLPNESIDYVFVDPPFGGNLNYSELNVLVEAWLQVRTSPASEAIVNEVQRKGLDQYRGLMARAFNEFYRVLKPGKWITVEFHNSENAVWNSIQEAIAEAGFVVANVRVLDKQKGTTKQLSYGATVKDDLMISAYKPTSSIESQISPSVLLPDAIWSFVTEHLRRLPISNERGGILTPVIDRLAHMLFDRLVAYCLRKGHLIPLSASEFYEELSKRYQQADGMFFLPDQMQRYLKAKEKCSSFQQLELFVSDEESAIRWLRHEIGERPRTFQEIQPDFMREVKAWRKHEVKPELSDLLEDNFLRYDGNEDVPSQIHSYLSTNFKDVRGLDKNSPHLVAKAKDRWYVPSGGKSQDLEKKREKALLKDFEDYKRHTGRKLKEFRLEVLRAGFKFCWGNRDYATIIAVAGKIPEDVLQEDEKLLLWYDQALTRMEGDS